MQRTIPTIRRFAPYRFRTFLSCPFVACVSALPRACCRSCIDVRETGVDHLTGKRRPLGHHNLGMGRYIYPRPHELRGRVGAQAPAHRGPVVSRQAPRTKPRHLPNPNDARPHEAAKRNHTARYDAKRRTGHPKPTGCAARVASANRPQTAGANARRSSRGRIGDRTNTLATFRGARAGA